MYILIVPTNFRAKSMVNLSKAKIKQKTEWDSKNSYCAIFVYFEEDIKIKAGKKSTIYPIGLWPIVNKVVYTVIGKPFKDGFNILQVQHLFRNFQFDF